MTVEYPLSEWPSIMGSFEFGEQYEENESLKGKVYTRIENRSQCQGSVRQYKIRENKCSEGKSNSKGDLE